MLLTRLQDRSGVSPRRQARWAAAATEFAFLSPLLAALIMGMAEMGRATMVKDILTDAARKGCRTGAWPTKGYTDIINDVNNILSDQSIPTASATIAVQVAPYTGTSNSPSWGSFTTVNGGSYSPNSLDQISVQVSVPATSVLWFTPIFMPSSSLESETVVMVRQG
jgi:Flp pilus assembly protein TadG